MILIHKQERFRKSTWSQWKAKRNIFYFAVNYAFDRTNRDNKNLAYSNFHLIEVVMTEPLWKSNGIKETGLIPLYKLLFSLLDVCGI